MTGVPLADVLAILLCVGVLMMGIGWLGARAVYREDDEPDEYEPWPPPGPAISAGAFRRSYPAVAMAMTEVHHPAPPPPPPAVALDDGSDRMPTIAELRDYADYRVTWTEVFGQVDSAEEWFDRTYRTGQFRAVKPDGTDS
jgi:hypothetical protein